MRRIVLTIAIEALSWIELKSLTCSSSLKRTVKQLNVKDKSAFEEAASIVQNVMRTKNYIDRVLEIALAPSLLSDFNFGVQSFLRIFAFESIFSFNNNKQAVELAKTGRTILGWENLMTVEAFLGNIMRVNYSEIVSGSGDMRKISLQTFFPEWYVSYCIRLLGRSEALKFLSYFKSPLKFVALNILKRSEAEILQEAFDAGIVLEKVEAIPYLYKIVDAGRNILQEYAKKLFLRQDMPSSLASALGKPKSGSTVLEVGINPIAKTLYLAELMGNTGKILVIDSSKRRLEAMTLMTADMDVNIIENFLEPPSVPNIGVKADIILLNPPSSGTGAFWREPSLKWKVDLESVKEEAKIQWGILNQYAKYVKDGGILIYWTNSVTIEENELQIERFLKLNPEFSLSHDFPKIGVSAFRGQLGCRRLYPHIHGVDGSYFAKLVKN